MLPRGFGGAYLGSRVAFNLVVICLQRSATNLALPVFRNPYLRLAWDFTRCGRYVDFGFDGLDICFLWLVASFSPCTVFLHPNFPPPHPTRKREGEEESLHCDMCYLIYTLKGRKRAEPSEEGKKGLVMEKCDDYCLSFWVSSSVQSPCFAKRSIG